MLDFGTLPRPKKYARALRGAGERERSDVAVAVGREDGDGGGLAKQSGRRQTSGRTDGRREEGRSDETAAKKGERRTIGGRRTPSVPPHDDRSYEWKCVVVKVGGGYASSGNTDCED